MAIISFGKSYDRKLLNLTKIYTNKTKYSGWNDNFIFKLAISIIFI